MVDIALVKFLLSKPLITAIVGNRISIATSVMKEPNPRIILRQTNEDYFRDLVSVPNLGRAEYVVGLIADTQKEVEVLKQVVWNHLDPMIKFVEPYFISDGIKFVYSRVSDVETPVDIPIITDSDTFFAVKTLALNVVFERV